MRFLRVALPFLLAVFVLSTPLVTQAAEAGFFGPIIEEDCRCEGSAPDWGCVLETAHNVFNLLFSLSILLFALTAAYAGILFMTSQVNSENKNQAKSALMNTVVGLLIAVSAWLMVDFVMRVLYDGEHAGWGPWNRILTENSARKCLRHATPQSISVDVDGGNVDVETGDALTAPIENGTIVECNRGNAGTYYPARIIGSVADGDELVSISVEYENGTQETGIPPSQCRKTDDESDDSDEVGADGNWQSFFAFDDAPLTGDVRDQIGDASNRLDDLLSCMAGNLPDGVGRISSISDKRFYFSPPTRTFAECGADPRSVSCGHMAGSCHYGGSGSCNGESYAVDFGDEQNRGPLSSVARACADARDIPGIFVLDEGDHIHISVDNNRCGCR